MDSRLKLLLCQRIVPGLHADLYVSSKPDVRFSGVVDSIGIGAIPDPAVIRKLGPGLPDVQRTLSWRLTPRHAVRARVLNPTPDLFRVAASAVVTIRGN
jgi:membrane fusion protein, multidrug efflux system